MFEMAADVSGDVARYVEVRALVSTVARLENRNPSTADEAWSPLVRAQL